MIKFSRVAIVLLFCCSFLNNLFAQTKLITGQVSDSNNVPISNATITVLGAKNGTISNSNGQYSLKARSGDVLEFSYIGYSPKRITVSDNIAVINVQLMASVGSQNEVVVVAYGKQKKVDLTGSVSTISSKEIENRPVTNLSNALQGAMPGITVTPSANAQPGADQATINIRGIGTLNNSAPMVVVDGVISSMNYVNPNDVASMSVLKDAASAAIYGSRAANGVILITTKKGQSGAPKLEYDNYFGKQTPTRPPQRLPSWQQAEVYNQAEENEGASAYWTAAQIQTFKAGSDPLNYPNTDWQGLLFHSGDGLQQNHYLSVSGGNDKSQYALSLGLFDEDGFIARTFEKRYTTRLNVGTTINKYLSANENLGFTYSNNQAPLSSTSGGGVGSFAQIIRLSDRLNPTFPVRDSAGHFTSVTDGNPQAFMANTNSVANDYLYNLQGSAGLDFHPIKGLSIRPSVMYILTAHHGHYFTASTTFYNPNGSVKFADDPSTAQDENEFANDVTYQTLAQYDKTIAGIHNISVLGGYSQEYYKFTNDNGYRQTYLNNTKTDLNLGSTNGQTSAGYTYDWGLTSVFGRLTYNYEEKYLFEANIRRDGSSRFAPNQQWGTFPSLSAGWNMDKEEFFQPLKSIIYSLKLRGSWGKSGNQILSSNLSADQQFYPFFPTVSTGYNYIFGGTSPVVATGVAPAIGVNPSISWETTSETDFGSDIRFLNGKLGVTADYYSRATSGILMALPVGATYGLSAPVENAANVLNRGWDFQITYNDQIGDLVYGVNANLSFVNNKITDLAGTGPYISGNTFQQVGYPINSYYGYVAQGIFEDQAQINSHANQYVLFPNTAPGDLMYKDLDGNDTINGADRAYLGTFFPKVTFGLNLTASYKGFDIAVLAQGIAGVKYYLDDGQIGIPSASIASQSGSATSLFLNAWTPDHHTNFPRAWADFTQNDPLTPSSYWARNGAYLRIKNIQIGYTIPPRLTKKIGIERLRIYYSGQNLFTFDALPKWVDPEAGRSTLYSYPQIKINTFGLNVSF